jgi:Pyocin activator protein PrtN
MSLFSQAEKLGLLLIMDTAFLLIAMYSGRPIIPAQDIARDFFGLSTEKFVRKVSAGEIALPLVRMEASQKCAKGVHINDLAEYLDRRRAAAVKECELLQGSGRL